MKKKETREAKETIARLKEKMAIMETIGMVIAFHDNVEEGFSSDYILDTDIAVSCKDGKNLIVTNINRCDNNYTIMTLNIEYLRIGQMADFILSYLHVYQTLLDSIEE